jgi:DNA-binding transcriptional MocR family regulator
MKSSSAVEYRYEQVAERITQLIHLGTLRPGERIPSVRRISRQEGVSISTALQAYFLLEDRGLIEARPQSGFYVRLQSRRLPPEPQIIYPPHAATEVGLGDLVSNILKAARNPDIVPLGVAAISPELLPTTKLHRILASVARRAGIQANRYDFAPGYPELRYQIARRSLDWGCSLSADDVVVTAGCTDALNLCLRAVAGPGDVIAVESPSYFVLLTIPEALQMKALEVPTYPREGVCLDELQIALDRRKVKACLFMTNFHNPLGSCMPDEKKKKLVEILTQRGIPLIEDDIYGDLYHGTSRPRVAKAFDKKGIVLLCSSFSKTLAPGHRVGWTAPGRFRAQVERLKNISTVGNALLPQMMVAEFLQTGGYDHYLRGIRKAFGQQVQVTSRAIGKYFPEGTKVTRPGGGIVLWVEMPAQVDALELYQKALEKNISVAPGPVFSASQGYRNFIRVNCGVRWSDRIEEALFILGREATELANKTASPRRMKVTRS